MIFITVFSLMVLNQGHPQEVDEGYLKAIGIPVIKNYTPKEYQAHSQNWAIVQDKKGIMYFGNSNGLLEYDGVSWRMISIPNGAVRSLAISNETENGIIYIGGIGEFGYLATDKHGTLKYKSLKGFLHQKENNIGDVWSTIINSDGVYFQTNSHLIRWNFQRGKKGFDAKLKIWNAKTFFNYAFIVDDRLYINEAEVGLSTLIGDTIQLLPNGKEFEDYPPLLMLPYVGPNGEKKILIGAQKKGFYLYDGLSFRSFKTGADEYIQKNKLYLRGAVLADSTIAIGTSMGGVVIINKKGKLIQYLNKSMGLKSNTISILFQIFLYYLARV